MPDTSKKQFVPSSLVPDQNPTGSGLETEDLSLAQALRTIRKRKYIILALLILGGLISFALVTLLRPYYSSLSAIEVDRQQGDMGANSLAGLAASLGGSDDVKTEIATEVGVLTSDSLGIETVERMHYEDHATGAWRFSKHFQRIPPERSLPLVEAPVTRETLLALFESHLTITPIQDTRLVQISFEDPDPKYAAAVTNALIKQYIDDRLSRRNSSTTQASEWMGGEIDNLKKQVQTAEQNLIAYQRKTGLIVLPAAPSSGGGGGGGMPSSGSPTTATSPVIERLTQLNLNLVQAESNRITLDALYRLAKAGNIDALTSVGGAAAAPSGSASGSSSGGASNGAAAGGVPSGVLAGLLAIRQQQTSIRLQIAAGLQTYGAKNPHLVELDDQLHVLDQQMHDEMGRVLKSLEMNYNVAVETEAGLKKAYETEEHAAYAMNDSEIHLAILQQEADSVRALYEDLYTKLQESILSEGTQSSDIELISQALPPAAPARPKKILDLALGIGAGLFLGLAAAFVVDSMDDTVVTSVELENLTGRPVVGSIPQFAQASSQTVRGSPDTKLSAAGAAGSESWGAFEAYRALRTTILLSSAGAPPRSLLLTSPLPGEGKTTTTYNLAICFAMLGSKVLAIDADLRRPALNKKAGLSNTSGLTNLLTSESPASEFIHQDPQQPNLFILPSGPIPPNPSELLGSQTFADLIAKLTVDYDFVLVDTPPAMLVADALVMSQRVDQVLVVTRSGMATRASVVRVIEKLQRSGAPLLGFVLNSVDVKSADYYYAHGYYGTDYYGVDKNGKNGK